MVKRILIALVLSLVVAASTSGIAWLLDPAVKKIFIEKNQSFFDLLTYVGAIYIAYLGLQVFKSTPMSNEEQKSTKLGPITGIILQVVNGKAWIHFLLLMTQFGYLFGSGFGAKIMLVGLNLVFGLPAVMTWAAKTTCCLV